MSVLNILRNAGATALLQTLRSLNSTGAYSNREGAGVTVYLDPGDGEVKGLTDTLGLSTEETECAFTVPYQTGFPPTGGINVGDTITFRSRVYEVRMARGKGPIGDDGAYTAYVISAVRVQASKAGANL